MSEAVRPWKGTIAVEGVQTSDRRTIEVGAIRLDERRASVRLLGAGTDQLHESVGTVDRVWREDGDPSVWAEGLIVWHTAERIETVAIEINPLKWSTDTKLDALRQANWHREGGDLVVGDAPLLCVIVNSQNPSWPDRVGINVGEVVGHACRR